MQNTQGGCIRGHKGQGIGYKQARKRRNYCQGKDDIFHGIKGVGEGFVCGGSGGVDDDGDGVHCSSEELC